MKQQMKGELTAYTINMITSAAYIQLNCNTESLCMRAGEALDTYTVKYRDAVEILKAEILLLTTESKLQLNTHLSGKFAKEKPGRGSHHCCFAYAREKWRSSCSNSVTNRAIALRVQSKSVLTRQIRKPALRKGSKHKSRNASALSASSA